MWNFVLGAAARETLPNGLGVSLIPLSLTLSVFDLCALHLFQDEIGGRVETTTHRRAANLIALRDFAWDFHTKFVFPAPS